MLKARAPVPASAVLIRSAVGQQELSGFADHLSTQGYTLLTRRLFLTGAIHFLCFEERQPRSQRFPDKDPLFAFLCHLGRCQCRWRHVPLGRSKPALQGIDKLICWRHERGAQCPGKEPDEPSSGTMSPSHKAFQDWLTGRCVGRKSCETYQRVIAAL